MTGADFLLPIAAGAAISWASYSVVAHAVSKQHISTLRATVWVKWFTEFGHLNRGDMLTSEQHRCHN
ncbi:hypothetical protein PO584_24080, partial [Escherichia coli]